MSETVNESKKLSINVVQVIIGKKNPVFDEYNATNMINPPRFRHSLRAKSALAYEKKLNKLDIQCMAKVTVNS